MSPLERRDDKLQELQIPGGQSGAPPAGDDPEEAVDELVDDVVSGEATEEEEEELEELYEEVGEGDQSTSETQALAVELESELDEEDAMRRLIRRRGDGSPKKPGPFRRLYRGETSFDFVGRRRTWFLISGTIIVLGMLSLGIRGLNLGIDFKGGTSWEVTAPGVSQTAAVNAVEAAGVSNPVVTILAGKTIEVQADLNNLAPAEQKTTEQNVVNALAKLAHVDQNVVSQSTVGPTWGSQVTQRALLGLVVFLIVVAIYISFRFEPKMALAAFVALMHDLLVTVGIYSIAGFQVTPDTVIAILTILGYSLYDTVVVFDRVRDNTKGFGSTGRMTYSEMVNLSMNQTLARSINTSLVAILPVLAVLVIGAQILGATTLQNYGLALFVGLLSGAYSSIFIAAPVLAILKEREPRYAAIRQRLERQGERVGMLTPSEAALVTTGGGRSGGGRSAAKPARQGPLRPGAAPSKAVKGAPAPSATTVADRPETAEPAVDEDDGAGGNGSDAAVVAGAAAATVARAATGAAKRPGPRPRKRSKGSKKRR